MIAALFVATGGTYFNRPDVDPWDVVRDARALMQARTRWLHTRRANYGSTWPQ